MKITTKQLVAGALMAALCCVSTAFTKIPVGFGYVHIGDMMVLLCAFLPGGWVGIIAAGLGSALADLIAGYPDFVVPTFIIKAAMALIVYFFSRGKNPLGWRTIAGMIIAGLVMIGGYLAYEVVRFGIPESGYWVAIIGNVGQATFGIIAGYIVLVALAKTKLLDKYRK